MLPRLIDICTSSRRVFDILCPRKRFNQICMRVNRQCEHVAIGNTEAVAAHISALILLELIRHSTVLRVIKGECVASREPKKTRKTSQKSSELC